MPESLEDKPLREKPKRASYSSLTMHRSCPQAFCYRYLHGLEKAQVDQAIERDFGTWWHAIRAADSIERGVKLGSLLERPKKLKLTDRAENIEITDDDPCTTLVDQVLKAAEAEWEKMPFEEQDAYLAKLGEPLPDRLANLNAAWYKEHAESIRRERPLFVELKWVREFKGREMVGYIDEVYEDTVRSLIVARDHKTTKQLSTQSTADDLMDSQLHFYTWGSEEVLEKFGLRIRAIAYDRVRTVRPKTPALTQAGNLSKQITDFDLDTYRAWAKGEDGKGVYFTGRKKDLSDAGYYTEEESMVEKLSSPSARSAWFQRTLTPLNMNVIRTHLIAGLNTMAEVDRTVEVFEKQGMAGRNFGGACRWCEFAKLCRAQMIGGPRGDYVLEDYGLKRSSF